MKRKMLALLMPKLIRNVFFVEDPDISKRTVDTQGPTINKNIETKKETSRVISEASIETEATEVVAEEVVITRINREEEVINQCSETSEYPNEIKWLLDSGCSDCIVNNCKFFEKYVNLENYVHVELPDGKILKATKIGNVKTYFKTYGNENEIDIKSVYYVKDIGKNILSLSRITNNNCTIITKNNNAKIFDQNKKLLAVAYQDDNLYKMKSYVKRNLSKISTIATKLTEKEKWHRALGHVNFQYLNILIKTAANSLAR